MRHSETPLWLTTRFLLLTTLLGAILGLTGPYRVHAYDPFNCYSWAEYRLGDLPPMWTMINGAKPITPEKGDLALFYYEKSGLPHVAVVEYVFSNGGVFVSEANMYHLYQGGMGIRYIEPSYHHLVGFYEQGETYSAK
jgi:hypothetical protein